jgi:hypothetical protein
VNRLEKQNIGSETELIKAVSACYHYPGFLQLHVLPLKCVQQISLEDLKRKLIKVK